MKKLIIAVIATLFCISTSLAQDTVTIKHTGYTTTYSKSLHYPVLVQWWDYKSRVSCKDQLPRKDAFAPDPLLPTETNLAKDYIGSGTDRGHMCPAADNECDGSKVLAECFYFSNMAPQYHSLNAGDWKILETETRDLAIKYDSIYVWCGSIGSAKKIGTTTIPTKCWKVIYIKKTRAYEAYIFDNIADKPKGLPHWKVKVADVEKLTGFKFSLN
jgi:endonuclease G